MSIYDFIKAQSMESKKEEGDAEAAAADTAVEETSEGGDVAEGDVVEKTNSSEEAEASAEVFDEEDHEESMDAIEEAEEAQADQASLESFMNTAIDYTQFVGNLSNESVTPLEADAVSIQNSMFANIVGQEIADKLPLAKYTPEHFSADVTEGTRALIASNSSEAMGETIKAGIEKLIQALLNAGKKVMEMITRLFANSDKLKARAQEAQKKSQGSYNTHDGEKKASPSLQVKGKFEPLAAVKSFRDHSGAVLDKADAKSDEGFKNLNGLATNMTSEDMKAKFKEEGSAAYGSGASDAKIFADFGGNLSVGVGGGVLYSVDEKAVAGKTKALTKSEIGSLMAAVVSDYDAMGKLSDRIKHINKNLEELATAAKHAYTKAYADDKVAQMLSNYIAKKIAKTQAKSGISVLQRLASRQYLACVEAVKLAEWSMSGRAGKEVATK